MTADERYTRLTGTWCTAWKWVMHAWVVCEWGRGGGGGAAPLPEQCMHRCGCERAGAVRQGASTRRQPHLHAVRRGRPHQAALVQAGVVPHHLLLLLQHAVAWGGRGRGAGRARRLGGRMLGGGGEAAGRAPDVSHQPPKVARHLSQVLRQPGCVGPAASEVEGLQGWVRGLFAVGGWVGGQVGMWCGWQGCGKHAQHTHTHTRESTCVCV